MPENDCFLASSTELEVGGEGYLRDPLAVARFLNLYYAGKRLLFFGTGEHSRQVRSALKAANCVGLVDGDGRLVERGDSHGESDIDAVLADASYDFLVLLGDWGERELDAFRGKYGASLPLVVPYRDHSLMAEIIEENVRDVRCMGHGKKVIVHILWYDKNNFLSEAAPTLSRSFDLVKIYLQPWHTYAKENGDYKKVYWLSPGRDNSHLVTALKLAGGIDPDLVVLGHSAPFHARENHWLMEQLQAIGYPAVIACACDLFCYKLFNVSLHELAAAVGKDEQWVIGTAACEQSLIRNSRAVIHSYVGDYRDEVIEKESRACFATDFFLHPNKFRFRAAKRSETYSLCFAGSLECMDNRRSIHHEAMDNVSLFKSLLEQGFTLAVYTFDFGQIGCYNELKTKSGFEWYSCVPNDDLHDQLASYDFGLVLYSVNGDLGEKLGEAIRSLMPTKVMSYLGAGLPIVVTRDFAAIADLVVEHGLGIVLDDIGQVFNLAQVMVRYPYPELKENVRRWQIRYAQEEHDRALGDFLLSCLL